MMTADPQSAVIRILVHPSIPEYCQARSLTNLWVDMSSSGKGFEEATKRTRPLDVQQSWEGSQLNICQQGLHTGIEHTLY